MSSLFLRLDQEPFVVEIRRGDRVRVGRHPCNDVVIGSAIMGKFQAIIGNDDEGGWIEDARSLAGTMVNRERVMERAALHAGDRIQMGGLTVYVHDRQPAPASDDADHWMAVLSDSPYADERWTAAQRLEELAPCPDRADAIRAALHRAMRDDAEVVRRWAEAAHRVYAPASPGEAT